MPIAFANLHGDASDPELQKQVKFLRRVSLINVILLSNGALEEDCTREPSTHVLRNLLEAPGGMIVLGVKGLNTQLKECIGETSKCILVKYDLSSFIKRLQNTLRSKLLEVTTKEISIETTARTYNIPIDEDDAVCVKGKQLMEDYRGRHPQRSPKDILPLQSENLLDKWVELQYQQRYKFHHKKSIGSEESLAVQYSGEVRKKMEGIRKVQSEKVNKGNVMPLFIKGLRQDKNVQLYFITWVRFASYQQGSNEAVIGSCLYGESHGQAAKGMVGLYNKVDRNISRQDQQFCGYLNREGRLCGHCQHNHFISAYSYDLKCYQCHRGLFSNIILYLVVAYVPLTVFLGAVVVFHIPLTSPRFSMAVLLCQRVYELSCRTQGALSSRFPLVLYGIWNLDFFRTLIPPICQPSK